MHGILASRIGKFLSGLPLAEPDREFLGDKVEIFPGMDFNESCNWNPLSEFEPLPDHLDKNKKYYDSFSYEQSSLRVYENAFVFGVGMWALHKKKLIEHILFHNVERDYARSLGYNWVARDFLTLLKYWMIPKSNGKNFIRKGIVLDGPFNHFGHWPFEHLTKLRQIEHLEGFNDIALLVQRGCPRWKRELLQDLGFTNQIIEINEGLCVHELFVPSYPQFCKTEVDWLRAKVLSSSSFEETNPSAFGIYLSRGEYGKRTFSNEDEVQQSLTNKGWKTYYPEQYSILEQASIIRASRGIIGVGGSALFHAIWLEKGCTVVYIGVGHLIPYLRLARIRGLNATVIWNAVVGEDGVALTDGDFASGILKVEMLVFDIV